MLSLSRYRLHGSPQMLFLLTFPSIPTLYVHIFHIMLIILNPCILFYFSQSSFHYTDIMFLRNLENKLFFSLFSVGTTAAQSAAGSVTPWTQMTSTPARPLAPTSTPHLSRTETQMNRSVIDTKGNFRASWSTESETSVELHMGNHRALKNIIMSISIYHSIYHYRLMNRKTNYIIFKLYKIYNKKKILIFHRSSMLKYLR